MGNILFGMMLTLISISSFANTNEILGRDISILYSVSSSEIGEFDIDPLKTVLEREKKCHEYKKIILGLIAK